MSNSKLTPRIEFVIPVLKMKKCEFFQSWICILLYIRRLLLGLTTGVLLTFAVIFSKELMALESKQAILNHLNEFLIARVQPNVHDDKLLKWNDPIGIAIFARASDDRRLATSVADEFIEALHHEIKIVGANSQEKVNVVITFTSDFRRELDIRRNLYKNFFESGQKFEQTLRQMSDQPCYVNTVQSETKSLVSGLVLINTSRQELIREKCVSIGMMHVLGLTYREGSDKFTVLTDNINSRPTSLDFQALRYMYQRKYRPGESIKRMLDELR